MTTKTINTLEELYEFQIEFQKRVLLKESGTFRFFNPETGDLDTSLPIDSTDWFKYHCLAMMEEMGEVLKADKRWKTHRNQRFEKEEKIDELADVFITCMNMSIFSGFSANELFEAVKEKIEKNLVRLKGE